VSGGRAHIRCGLWLRALRPRPDARLRLVCFAHAGAGAGFFRTWPDLAPPSVEVLAVQYAGREDRIREPCAIAMDALADPIATALAAIADRPLALFGHSLGAAVAYEVALRLQAAGTRPVTLFASGRRAPQLHRPSTRHLDSDGTLWQSLRTLGGTTEEILEHAGLRALVLPILRSDYSVSETWRPCPDGVLDADVVAYVGDTPRSRSLTPPHGGCPPAAASSYACSAAATSTSSSTRHGLSATSRRDSG
jgi:pyochelin biosynthetic protein PchC